MAGLVMNERRHTLERSKRLSRDRDYQAVFAARARRRAGPLTVCTRPNEFGHHRLGLSVGRRVGKAVVRNRIKRLLREAFRLSQHDLPGSYDIVILVYPHEPLPLSEYQRLLADAVTKSHRRWERSSASPPPQTKAGES